MKSILTGLTLVLLLLNSSFAQTSQKLEQKAGFKEILLLRNAATIKTSRQFTGVGFKRYEYAGDSKSLYNIPIPTIIVEADGENLIRKIRLEFGGLDTDDFLKLNNEIKNDFGVYKVFGSEENSKRTLVRVWVSANYYMEYMYTLSSGKTDAIINIGLLRDLDPAIKEIYLRDSKDGF